MSIKQYPYTLQKLVLTGSTQDEDGNWSTPSESWVDAGICRDESNTKGAIINLVDGNAYVFASSVYMPKSTGSIDVGTTIQVKDGENIRVTGKVKRFLTNQFNCMLWV